MWHDDAHDFFEDTMHRRISVFVNCCSASESRKSATGLQRGSVFHRDFVRGSTTLPRILKHVRNPDRSWSAPVLWRFPKPEPDDLPVQRDSRRAIEPEEPLVARTSRLRVRGRPALRTTSTETPSESGQAVAQPAVPTRRDRATAT